MANSQVSRPKSGLSRPEPSDPDNPQTRRPSGWMVPDADSQAFLATPGENQPLITPTTPFVLAIPWPPSPNNSRLPPMTDALESRLAEDAATGQDADHPARAKPLITLNYSWCLRIRSSFDNLRTNGFSPARPKYDLPFVPSSLAAQGVSRHERAPTEEN